MFETKPPHSTVEHPEHHDRLNREDYALETRLNGWEIFDLVRDGSHQSAMYSGDRARLQQKWSVGTLGTTPQVTVGYEGYRTIR